jgi:hypothetical protein
MTDGVMAERLGVYLPYFSTYPRLYDVTDGSVEEGGMMSEIME